MAIDIQGEVIAALKSPEGKLALRDVFRETLHEERAQEASPLVGAQEAAQLLGIKSKTKRLMAKALDQRVRRDPDLAALAKKIRGRRYFDRVQLLQFIRAHMEPEGEE